MGIDTNLEDRGRGLFQTKNPAVPLERLTNIRKQVVRKGSNSFRPNDESVGF